MFTMHNTFIGIDPTAGKRPFTYAALDNELRLLSLGQARMDEVLAFAGGQRAALVAVCAPRRPNQGLMRQTALREQLSPPPRPARWQNLRLVEYLLRQHNIRCPLTPSEEKACPNWMQMGFGLYHKLEGLGYAPFPCENETLQCLEVYPHACFCALLGRTPFPKELLEGRLQRQLVLYDRDLHVPDPLRFFEEITRHRLLQGILPLDNLYTPGELDALVAAFTAWMAVNHPEQSLALGDPRDGVIYLPVGELKRHYSSKGMEQ